MELDSNNIELDLNKIELDLNKIEDSSIKPLKEDLDKAEKEETTNFHHLKDRYQKDTALRIKLVNIFSRVIAVWLAAVILILVFNTYFCHLSDQVLITLMVTSTANVIGMMLIILKNLFPVSKEGSLLT
jgi:hypothetical protein